MRVARGGDRASITLYPYIYIALRGPQSSRSGPENFGEKRGVGRGEARFAIGSAPQAVGFRVLLEDTRSKQGLVLRQHQSGRERQRPRSGRSGAVPEPSTWPVFELARSSAMAGADNGWLASADPKVIYYTQAHNALIELARCFLLFYPTFLRQAHRELPRPWFFH